MKAIAKLLSAVAALCMLFNCSVFNKTASSVGSTAGSIFRGGVKTFTYYNLPENVQDLQSLQEANRKDAYGVAAMTVTALCRYETNPEECFKMLNWLKGEEPLTSFEKEFLRDRLAGKGYKARSYFAGATPENGYTPSMPYKLTPVSNPYTFKEDGWATVSLRSGHDEKLRAVKLRQKKSTGEWFLNDIQCVDDDIPAPVNKK
jgi:hypothetical protein